jgi:hypothetical protein
VLSTIRKKAEISGYQNVCAAMVKIVDMDEKVTLGTQLEGDVDGGAVIYKQVHCAARGCR